MFQLVWCVNPAFLNLFIALTLFVTHETIMQVSFTKWGERLIRDSSSEKLTFFSFYDLIPNPLADDILPNISEVETSFTSKRQPGSIAFFASYERGGPIAEKVYCGLRESVPNISYVVATYEMTAKDGCGPINNHGGLSKQALYEVMLQSSVFLYPLKIPHGHLFHKVSTLITVSYNSFSLKLDQVRLSPCITLCLYQISSTLDSINTSVLSDCEIDVPP